MKINFYFKLTVLNILCANQFCFPYCQLINLINPRIWNSIKILVPPSRTGISQFLAQSDSLGIFCHRSRQNWRHSSLSLLIWFHLLQTTLKSSKKVQSVIDYYHNLTNNSKILSPANWFKIRHVRFLNLRGKLGIHYLRNESGSNDRKNA